MGDQVITLSLLKSMLEAQDRAYQNTVETIMNSIKDDVKALSKEIQDLKSSLEFSQKDITDLKKNLEKIERKVEAQSTIQKESQAMLHDNFDEVYDQVEYLENQSRRNNIRLSA